MFCPTGREVLDHRGECEMSVKGNAEVCEGGDPFDWGVVYVEVVDGRDVEGIECFGFLGRD